MGQPKMKKQEKEELYGIAIPHKEISKKLDKMAVIQAMPKAKPYDDWREQE
jgi:hypothetical protein